MSIRVLRILSFRRFVIGILITALLGLLPAHAQMRSGSSAGQDSEVATAWFRLQLQLIQQTPGFSPPVASRALGYAGVTLYESVAPGFPGYRSLAGQLNDLKELPQPSAGVDFHWETVANSALATITRHLFPTASDENKRAVDELDASFAARYSSELESDVFARSVTQGRVVGDAIYIWSLTDGGHEGFLTSFREEYQSPSGTGLWSPTPRTGGDPLPALQPYWGNNRPFILSSAGECAPPAPPSYSSNEDSAFYREAREVYDTTQALTPEQLEIASFWSDDPGATVTPPGHSISILTQILEAQGAHLEVAAEAYARVGIAIADSFIGCWHAKFQHNVQRPITFIQETIDLNWSPLLVTPPFPEYPSGHSVQSGAAAVVLADMFGDELTFVDHTHDARGLAPRTFHSFAEFADEAAISRMYGGIHYRFAIEQGLEQGRCIGQQVNALEFRHQ